MMFTIQDLKLLSTSLETLKDKDIARLSKVLHRRQPSLANMIDDVGTDPRCVSAHRYCTLFCALALIHAEWVTRFRVPKYSRSTIHEMASFIVQDNHVYIGKRGTSYRARIERHVLPCATFDMDDTNWLTMTISAFLFLIEKSTKQEEAKGDNTNTTQQDDAHGRGHKVQKPMARVGVGRAGNR